MIRLSRSQREKLSTAKLYLMIAGIVCFAFSIPVLWFTAMIHEDWKLEASVDAAATPATRDFIKDYADCLWEDNGPAKTECQATTMRRARDIGGEALADQVRMSMDRYTLPDRGIELRYWGIGDE